MSTASWQISGAYGAFSAAYPVVTLNTGTPVTFNTSGFHQTVYSNATGTKATANLILPTGTASTLAGQLLRYVSEGAITTLTVSGSGNVLVGSPVTGLSGNGSVAWQAISTSGTYIRIQ